MYTKFAMYVIRDDGACIPLDIQNSDYRDFLAWAASGNTPADPPTPPIENRINALRAAIAAHLDAAAHAKGYDNIINAALRAAYPGPYYDEGAAFAAWMDACWATAYALLAKWQAGELSEPSPAELIEMLPVLEMA